MLDLAFYYLLILHFPAAAQWTQPTNQYLNQPVTSSSSSNNAGYPVSWTANTINNDVTTPHYAGSSWSTSNSVPQTTTTQTYQETSPGTSTAEETYPMTSEKTYTETTKGPYTDTTTSSTTENPQWPTEDTMVSANSENRLDEKPEKIVEANLVESSPIKNDTASQTQADVPGSESKTALPGRC